MQEINGIPIDPIKGLDDIKNLAGSAEADLEEALQYAIGESITEGITDAVRDALLEEGYTQEDIDTLANKGTEMLERKIPEYREPPEDEEPEPELPDKPGPAPNPKSYNYPDKPEKRNTHNIGTFAKSAYGKASERAKKEAEKEGFEKFVTTESSYHSNDKSVIRYRARNIKAALNRMHQLNQEIEQLPPDPPRKQPEPVKDITDEEARKKGYADNGQYKAWTEDGRAMAIADEENVKDAELRDIKMYAEMALFNPKTGQIGKDALIQVAKDYDDLIENLNTPQNIGKANETEQKEKPEATMEELAELVDQYEIPDDIARKIIGPLMPIEEPEEETNEQPEDDYGDGYDYDAPDM